MWYSTIPETQPAMAPPDVMAGQQPEFPVEQAATTACSEKARTGDTPGSEYWLP